MVPGLVDAAMPAVAVSRMIDWLRALSSACQTKSLARMQATSNGTPSANKAAIAAAQRADLLVYSILFADSVGYSTVPVPGGRGRGGRGGVRHDPTLPKPHSGLDPARALAQRGLRSRDAPTGLP